MIFTSDCACYRVSVREMSEGRQFLAWGEDLVVSVVGVRGESGLFDVLYILYEYVFYINTVVYIKPSVRPYPLAPA